MGVWNVITPEYAVNKVLNPVAQGAGNYVAFNGSTVNSVTSASYLGYRCYEMVGVGIAFWGIQLELSQLAGAPGAIQYVTLRLNYALGSWTLPPACALDGATYHTMDLLGIEGDWRVYGHQIPAAEALGSVHLNVVSGGESVTMYFGHFQVEENTHATTPITGDLKSFAKNGYYWLGGPHTSASARAAFERSGGVEHDLDTEYKFKVRYAMGIGMPPIANNSLGMALLPGALFQGEKIEPRVLDLLAVTDEEAPTPITVHKARKNFINAIKSDLVSPKQPVVFRYKGANASKPVEFYGRYDDGLQFQINDGMIEKPVARFLCLDPMCYEVHTQSKYLTVQDSIANADHIIRKIDGNWYNIDTDFNHTVEVITKGIDGCIYIGGGFTDVGDANGDYIVKWNPFSGTLSSLGLGMHAGGDVYALAPAPNGDIYAGGIFSDAGDVAATNNIAFWDVSASVWVTVGGGITAVGHWVNALVFGYDGTLYIGGSFHDQFDANGNCITRWIGGAYSSMGAGGADNTVWDLAIAPNGDLYAVGAFHNIGGVACNHIAKYDVVTSTWSPLGTGLDDVGMCLAIDKAGRVYVGGIFHNADGIACAHIAMWNGKTFEPLGTGVNAECDCLFIDENGLVYAGGLFTSAGGITLSDRIAIWNRTTWVHLDADLPAASTVFAIYSTNNNLYIGYDTSGTAYSSHLNAVTNIGSATAYPKMILSRTGGTYARLQFIKNETTGDPLWCDYVILLGEILTIDFTPGNRSIKSNFFGDVWRAVLRSSEMSSFRLLPGLNNISVYCEGDSFNVWMEWPITHWAADMVSA